MVNIRTPENTNNNITVSSPNTNNAVNTLNSVVFSEDLSQQWAVKLDGKVKNEDYSSKYYALQSKACADSIEADAIVVKNLKPQLEENFEAYSTVLTNTAYTAIEELKEDKNEYVEEIGNIKNEVIEQVNSVTKSSIQEISNKSQNLLNVDLSNISEVGLSVLEQNSGSGFNLFDTKITDYIIPFEQSEGWALQGTYVYKEPVMGVRYGYPDFYNTCLNEFETATLSGDILNANIIGTLTNNSGVVSEFNTGNYVTLPKGFNPQSATWELVLKYKCVHDTTTGQDIFNSMNGSADMGIHLLQDPSTHKLVLYLCSNGSTWDIASGTLGATTLVNNTTYYIKFAFDGSSYKLYLSTTGEFNGEETLDLQINNSATLYSGMNTTYIGNNGHANSRGAFVRGSIDFKESYIKIDNEYFWQGCLTYQNANGHKFYDIADKTVIDEWYETYGIADFYGIDTENERIFLPRNKHFMQLTDDTSKVNEMVEAGLPNITGSTILASDTVQPQASLKLLYYCVGNTSSSKAITDVTEITTSENDTLPLFHNFYSKEDMTTTGAYVNASLGSWLSGNIYETAYNDLVNKIGTGNVKAVTNEYTDFDFVVNQDDMTFRLPLLNGDECLPSDNKISQTILASGESYTAPQNGWYSYLVVSSVANGTVNLYCEETGLAHLTQVNANLASRGSIPVSKGDVVNYIYPSNSTNILFFIPAKGDGNLYYKVANAVTNLELLNTGEVLNAVNSLIPDNSSLITSFPMPSNRYIDLTLGASGSTYTAPANGWFNIVCKATNTANNIFMSSSNLASQTQCINTTFASALFLPVVKGTTVTIGFNNMNITQFRFTYAEGEQ